MRLRSLRSTSKGVLPGAKPVRFPRRNKWVSTAIVGSPNATFKTTFAVLRPTPGRASSASRVLGTLPPCKSTSMWQVWSKCRALLRKRPMVLMWFSKPSKPKLRIFCGVGATTNNRRVALLTPMSVACAESNTAANNSNTLAKCNSVCGWGLAACRVEKKVSIWEGVIKGGRLRRQYRKNTTAKDTPWLCNLLIA